MPRCFCNSTYCIVIVILGHVREAIAAVVQGPKVICVDQSDDGWQLFWSMGTFMTALIKSLQLQWLLRVEYFQNQYWIVLNVVEVPISCDSGCRTNYGCGDDYSGSPCALRIRGDFEGLIVGATDTRCTLHCLYLSSSRSCFFIVPQAALVNCSVQ